MKTNSTTTANEYSHLPDVNYFLTLDGLLQCLAIALNFLCFLCISVGGYYMGIGFSTFVAVIGFTAGLIFLLLYLFNLADNFEKVPWAATEMAFCFVWTLFSFISGSILAVAATQHEGSFGWAIAAFFSFSTMCVYGLNCYLKFCDWKREDSPDMEEV